MRGHQCIREKKRRITRKLPNLKEEPEIDDFAMPRLFKDRFTEWLTAKGTPPSVYQPGGLLGYPPMGWEVKARGTSIVYVIRKEEPEVLLIIMLEREQNRKGLTSPFACLIRFLRLLDQSGAGVTHVIGRIHAIEGRPDDSLTTERMKPFYVEHLGGDFITDAEGTEWVRGSVKVALEGLARQT